jgi:CHAD domain-containing protein
MEGMWQLADHIDKREEKILALLKKPAKNFSPDSFHLLRVELKKTDALFRLAGFYSKKFSRKKKFRAFKSIFAAAGEVRELQIMESMLKRNTPKSGLRNFSRDIRRFKKEKRAAFFALIRTRPKQALVANIESARKEMKGITRKDVLAYQRKLSGEIRRLLQKGKPDAPTLHRIRKLLKRQGYVSRPLPLKGHETTMIPQAEKLAAKLGEWHDLDVMALRLREMSEQEDSVPSERKILLALSKKFHARSVESLRRLVRIFSNISATETR